MPQSKKFLKRSLKFEDLGFGTKITENTGRFILKNGKFNIKRSGIDQAIGSSYIQLLEMSNWKFFGLLLCSFFLMNAAFGLLFFYIGIEQLSVPSTGHIDDYLNCMHFSIQTFTSVGYGAISPTGHLASFFANLVAFAGLLTAALWTGLLFARFSKPKAMLLFSEQAVLTQYRGDPHTKAVMFRTVNSRNTRFMDAEAVVTVTWIDTLEDGSKTRRFARLDLERDKIVLMPLNWTIVHIINEQSPLHGMTEEIFKSKKIEFLVIVKGFDEIFADNVFASTSYIATEIKWGYRFKPMYYSDENGNTVLELEQLNAMVPNQ